MTKDELKKYILSKMTAEEALDIYLQLSLNHYERLKDDKGEQEGHPIFIIAAAAMDLGWDFLVEAETVENDEVRGVAVGTREYLDNLLNPKKQDE